MEAHRVAGRIKELLDSEFLIWDKDENAYRPAVPGDVTILFRTLMHADDFERALESHNIPYRAAAGGSFYNRSEDYRPYESPWSGWRSRRTKSPSLAC